MSLQYDLLRHPIADSVPWRRRIALKFPGDPRNALAAEMLARLAQTQEDEIDAELWAKVSPYLGTEPAREVTSITVRSVGFSIRPRTMNEFLEALLYNFEQAQPKDGAKLAAVQGGAR